MPNIIIHIQNEEAILGEIDELPAPTHSLIVVKHPRRRDGKDLAYLDQSVTTMIVPLMKINYIEVMPAAEEDEIISFVRE